MSAFVHWAIAYGVHYGVGRFLAVKLIIRKSDSEKLINEWQKAIIWC